jgi:hypothetical protein
MRPLLRMTPVMFVGFATFFISWRAGFGMLMIMHAAYFGFAVMLLFLWRRGSFSVRIAVAGGTQFALIYFIELLVWHWIDPGFSAFWKSAPAYLFRLPFPPNLPVEELIWAASYGALWSNLLAYGFGADTKPLRPLKAI